MVGTLSYVADSDGGFRALSDSEGEQAPKLTMRVPRNPADIKTSRLEWFVIHIDYMDGESGQQYSDRYHVGWSGIQDGKWSTGLNLVSEPDSAILEGAVTSSTGVTP